MIKDPKEVNEIAILIGQPAMEKRIVDGPDLKFSSYEGKAGLILRMLLPTCFLFGHKAHDL
jgi:hypothetical protein